MEAYLCRYSGCIQLGEDHRADPEDAEEIINPICPDRAEGDGLGGEAPLGHLSLTPATMARTWRAEVNISWLINTVFNLDIVLH